MAVKSEEPGPTPVTVVGAGGTVLLRGLGEGVQQTPPGRFSNIGHRMKSILVLVIGKQWDIVTQRLLNESFNRNCPTERRRALLTFLSIYDAPAIRNANSE